MYRTDVEMTNGSAGENDSIVYGVANELDTSTAIALHVVWNNGGSITGWVGTLTLSSSFLKHLLWLICQALSYSTSMLKIYLSMGVTFDTIVR